MVEICSETKVEQAQVVRREKEQNKIRELIKIMGSNPEQSKESKYDYGKQERISFKERIQKSNKINSEKKISFIVCPDRSTELSPQPQSRPRQQINQSSLDKIQHSETECQAQPSWQKKLSENQMLVQFPQLSQVKQTLAIGQSILKPCDDLRRKAANHRRLHMSQTAKKNAIHCLSYAK